MGVHHLREYVIKGNKYDIYYIPYLEWGDNLESLESSFLNEGNDEIIKNNKIFHFSHIHVIGNILAKFNTKLYT